MITISSNINEFLKTYRKKVEKIKNVLLGIAEKLANQMAQDMYNEIKRTENIWAIEDNLNNHDETGKMGFHMGKDFNYWFDIQLLENNSARVTIGQKAEPHILKDGTIVNPAFFIEFGFGIVGQNNPAKNSEAVGWVYNKNNHEKAWQYLGWDFVDHISDGAKGINFMYNTIEKYRGNWSNYLKQLFKEQMDG
jgi:hypothetical protein